MTSQKEQIFIPFCSIKNDVVILFDICKIGLHVFLFLKKIKSFLVAVDVKAIQLFLCQASVTQTSH